MKTVSNNLQSAENPSYAGVSSLIDVEKNLKNYNQWIVEKVVGALDAEEVAPLVDFGCGIGTLAILLKKRVPNEILGVELDPRLAEISQGRGVDTASAIEGCGPNLGGVFSSNVLEHIEDDESTLRMLAGKLSAGQKIILFLPAFPLLWTTMDESVGHFRRYLASDLIAKMNAAGFRVARWEYCDSMGFFATLAFRAFSRGSAEPSARSLYFYDKCILPLTKITDRLFRKILGKNIFLVAVRV